MALSVGRPADDSERQKKPMGSNPKCRRLGGRTIGVIGLDHGRYSHRRRRRAHRWRLQRWVGPGWIGPRQPNLFRDRLRDVLGRWLARGIQLLGLICPWSDAKVISGVVVLSGVAPWSLPDEGCRPGVRRGLARRTEPLVPSVLERAVIRCSSCRSAVPLTVLWAVGHTCPSCNRPLRVARRRAGPDEAPGDTLAKPHADSRAKLERPGAAQR